MREESMVERVARAIARTQSGSLFREECTPIQLDAFGYMGAARAAIETMREPTLPMQNAGWREIDKQGFQTEDTEVSPIFRSMIDAALNEKA